MDLKRMPEELLAYMEHIDQNAVGTGGKIALRKDVSFEDLKTHMRWDVPMGRTVTPDTRAYGQLQSFLAKHEGDWAFYEYDQETKKRTYVGSLSYDHATKQIRENHYETAEELKQWRETTDSIA